MSREVNWAVLGTGVIANEFAQAMKKAGRRPYAVGNRTVAKAYDYAQKYGIAKVYEDFRAMFTDENVDVIYITTPHNTHIDFMLEALKNGKHLLVEKSITLNSSQLEKAVRLAAERNLVLAEAMTIYHMPLYKKLRQIVQDGELGKISMIQVNFGSYKEYDMKNRFFNMELAGGALLDIGVYAISLARLFLQSKPDEILSTVRYAPSGSDEMSGIVMTNPDGQMVVISLTMHCKQPKRCNICGDKGYIEIMEYPRAQQAKIVYTADCRVQEINEGTTADALYYELLDMEKAICGDKSVMLLDYTRDVMDIMTKIRNNWGMKYPEEL